jgi:hypothetical protein
MTKLKKEEYIQIGRRIKLYKFGKTKGIFWNMVKFEKGKRKKDKNEFM